jgi:hypothetical protein
MVFIIKYICVDWIVLSYIILDVASDKRKDVELGIAEIIYRRLFLFRTPRIYSYYNYYHKCLHSKIGGGGSNS